MKIIKSASVACGFHAGDPNTMHRLCMLAKQEGVSVGVHPGFNDLWGFGRRRIQMKPSDLEYMVAYQIGALQAMAAYAGPEGHAPEAARRAQQHGGRGRGLRHGHRPRHQDRRQEHHLRRAVRLADAEGGREARAAAGARGLPRPPLRRRRQPGLRVHPGHGAQGPQGRQRAGRAHGARRRDRLAQRQARQGRRSHAVRPRRRGDRRCGGARASARRWRRPASRSCRCPR